MISTSNVTLRVGKKALFEDVNIKFTEGNCYGLIGANGAGKSTFLKILSGQLEPTNGEVIITPGERLSFLQQDHFKYDEYPVLDTVMMGNARLYEIMKEKEAIYAKEDFTDEDGMKASELEGEFAAMNGWEAESDAATLLNGLGIPVEMHYEMMKNLNGPEKVKVLLAQALFGNPDILLLYYAYCFVIFSAKTVKIQSLFHISSHIPCKKSSNLFAWNNNGNPRRIKIYKFCGNFPCTFFQKTKLGWGIHCPGNGHKLLHRTTLAGIFFIS